MSIEDIDNQYYQPDGEVLTVEPAQHVPPDEVVNIESSPEHPEQRDTAQVDMEAGPAGNLADSAYTPIGCGLHPAGPRDNLPGRRPAPGRRGRVAKPDAGKQRHASRIPMDGR